MEDILFQEQGIKIGLLQFLKSQPGKNMGVDAFLYGKAISFLQEFRIPHVHKKINAQLMIVEPVHLLPEKALAQPQGTKDFWGDSQFLPQLPDNRFFSGFPQLHPPAGK